MKRLLPAVRAWSGALLASSLLLAVLHGSAELFAVRSEWPVWLPLLQLGGMALILLVCGRPRTGREWRGVVLWNGWIAATTAAFALQWTRYALFWGMEIGLRVLISGLWIFAAVGLPIVAVWLWLRSRSRSRRSAVLPRYWFATVVFLLAAEPLAALWSIKQPDDPPLELPENLPAPPAGEWHIAAIGGSTTAGSPYHPRFGIPAVMKWRLEQALRRDSDGDSASGSAPVRLVVRNLAKMGYNLRLAATQLGELRYRPHLLLVYTGHNEFYHDLDKLNTVYEPPFEGVDRWLNRSALFRLADGLLSPLVAHQRLRTHIDRQLVDHPIVTAAEGRERFARFQRQLNELAEYCQRSGIDTLWFVPAASESGFDPNRSFVAGGASGSEQAKIVDLYRRARELERRFAVADAAILYRRGLEEYPGFAEFEFRLGQCLLVQGRPEEAQVHFARALEHDGHPNRAIGAYRQAIAAAADHFGTPCIDAADVLRPHTPAGILDRTMFHDNVHPTLRGYFLLGMAAADRIIQQRPEMFHPSAELPSASLAAAMSDLGIGAAELADAYDVTAAGLEWMTRLRFETSARLRDADQYRDWARRLRSGEIQPGEAGLETIGSDVH